MMQYHEVLANNLTNGKSSGPLQGGDACAKKSLLLIEASRGSRAVLERLLTAQEFEVTSVPDAEQAYAAADLTDFAYVVVSSGIRDRSGPDVIRRLRGHLMGARIVVVTDVDSFASVVVALRAGADDFVAKSATSAELADALLDRSPELPPIPSMPLGLSRVCWEHIMRVHEQCGRNVSLTAQRLSMHRRSLQRILGKRAPQPRAAPTARAATDVPGSRFRRQHAGSRMRQL
jgi:two-component system, response regulator RegA